MYEEALEDIIDRTNGDFDKMTLADKIFCKHMALDVLDNINLIMDKYYSSVLKWAQWDAEKYVLMQKDPDKNALNKLFN